MEPEGKGQASEGIIPRMAEQPRKHVKQGRCFPLTPRTNHSDWSSEGSDAKFLSDGEVRSP